MLSDENVYHNPFNAPYGVYPANEESLRHAARMDQDQWDVHREALLRPLESTPDGYYICKPILSMDAVLSRFADNLHNLNQRRENDANRQRQSRARKKAGKTGHVTKRRRTSGGGDPDTTPPGATNSGGHVTNSVTQAASCHADSHVTPSLGRHVTASGHRRDYIENPPVFSLLSPAPVAIRFPGSAEITLREPAAVVCASSRRSSSNYNDDHVHDSFSSLGFINKLRALSFR